MKLQAYKFQPLGELEPNDTRFFQVISPVLQKNTRFVILGFPIDEGVRRNGGRPGARFAPDTIRNQFYRWVAPSEIEYGILADLGNVDCSGLSLEEAQIRLGEIIAELLSKNLFPIVLGGGHETAFGHFLGYSNLNQSVTILNLDAHTDVRPLKQGLGHSGSPFWQAMNHPSNCLERYHVIGAQRFSVSRHHADRVRTRGSIQFNDESITIPNVSGKTYLSIDLDVLDQVFMPGVSATNPNGFQPEELTAIIQDIFFTNSITSLDIVELNPLVDLNSMSAKRASYLLFFVISQLLQRATI